jgi:beta-glucanase (GH16 family)
MPRLGRRHAIALICAANTAMRSSQSMGKWKLVWEDDFSGAMGSPPDPSKWTYDLGNGDSNPGFGNSELQYYTDSTKNVFLDGRGHLVIRALRTPDGGYASGRIKTQGRFAFKYGKVEAGLRVPHARGIWPAFWMLGADYPVTPWPLAGELDVMEHFGVIADDPKTNHATIHGPGYSGGAGVTTSYSGAGILSDSYHVYGIEWEHDKIEFFLDGLSYATYTFASLPAGAPWVFDKPFFMLLNIAVGGVAVGYPDETTTFPQDMLVDYIRVYQRHSGLKE